jgi:hypothetical protein
MRQIQLLRVAGEQEQEGYLRGEEIWGLDNPGATV